MEPYNKTLFAWNRTKADAASLIKINYEAVKRAKQTSDVNRGNNETKITQPVADVELVCTQDGFIETTVIYLTSQQKKVYNNVGNTIVCGAAVVGKHSGSTVEGFS